MILEAIVTTRNADRSINIAPMGPHCQRDSMHSFELRPFQESTTFQNLVRTGEGVMHISDDVLLFAQAAGQRLPSEVPMGKAAVVDGCFLKQSCRYFEYRVAHIDSSQPRASIQCQTVASATLRDFFGFNRAMHQVIEAAILVTRLDLLPREEVAARFREFWTVIRKTGGEREKVAFDLLCDVAKIDPGRDAALAHQVRSAR